jgi:hypothetical protein
MDGTAVLLPLRPPHYEPRVLIAGGTSTEASDQTLRGSIRVGLQDPRVSFEMLEHAEEEEDWGRKGRR